MAGSGTRDAASVSLDKALADFEAARPRLFGIAYRMLCSVAEAQDVVQDAWLRWQATDRESVREPVAFLSTITTRLAITAATSARARREVYVGPWLPEPVLTADDPTLGAERAEALELGLLRVMERLSPKERAVYLLREAFDYSFADIAAVLDTTEANARQLARRARVHLEEARPARVERQERDRLLAAFLAAAQGGDLTALESLLAADVVYYGDGGGAVSAARRPIVGRDDVIRFLVGVGQKSSATDTFAIVEANGADALLVLRDGEPYILGSVSAGEHGIDGVYFVMNPAKLGGLVSRATA
jgi:RNA polymerase sigma-70 factor (ECF subfamily)